MTTVLLLGTLLALAYGGFMGFIRGESIPGSEGLTIPWLLQETTDGRWTLHRWAMMVAVGIIPVFWLLHAALLLPWFTLPLLWVAMGAAWSMPHSPFIPNNNWMIGVSGLAMTLPATIVLMLVDHWTAALFCAAAGALKPIVYIVLKRVTPAGLAFPFWWTVLAEIINGALEIGVPSALLLAI
jgi:hypothetical protein